MVEHLLEVIQRPHVLQDRVHPQPERPRKSSTKDLQHLLERIKMRDWVYRVQDSLMELIIELRREVEFIEHLQGCCICKMELRLDVERYNGSRLFWYTSLENSEYLERRYPSCPKEQNYHIGNYWEQVAYYREHGTADVPGENTLDFILARAKWAYKIIGKQIRVARHLLHMARNWNFNDTTSMLEFNRIYDRLGRYDVALPFEP
jgi:hypothetical protein